MRSEPVEAGFVVSRSGPAPTVDRQLIVARIALIIEGFPLLSRTFLDRYQEFISGRYT